jgi:hypothetical protein
MLASKRKAKLKTITLFTSIKKRKNECVFKNLINLIFVSKKIIKKLIIYLILINLQAKFINVVLN